MMNAKNRKRAYERQSELSKNEIVSVNTRLDKLQKDVDRITQENNLGTLIMKAIIFLLSVILEVGLSIEVYVFTIQRHVGGNITFVNVLTASLILIVITLAAFFGSLIGFGLYRGVFLERITELESLGYSILEIQRKIRIERIRKFIYGVIGSIILLVLVAYFSWLRVQILTNIDPSMEYSIIEILLPPIFVFLELIFSSHIKIISSLSFKLVNIKRLKLRDRYLRQELYEYQALINSIDED